MNRLANLRPGRSAVRNSDVDDIFPIRPSPLAHCTGRRDRTHDNEQLTTDVYSGYLNKGFDIRPTIAITKAHIDLPETREAVQSGRLKPDGKVLLPSGQSIVSKAAIEPVWYLPEIARRFGCTETTLRQSIFQMTNGMYPEVSAGLLG